MLVYFIWSGGAVKRSSREKEAVFCWGQIKEPGVQREGHWALSVSNGKPSSIFTGD